MPFSNDSLKAALQDKYIVENYDESKNGEGAAGFVPSMGLKASEVFTIAFDGGKPQVKMLTRAGKDKAYAFLCGNIGAEERLIPFSTLTDGHNDGLGMVSLRTNKDVIAALASHKTIKASSTDDYTVSANGKSWKQPRLLWGE